MHFSLDKSTIYNALQKIFNFNLISKKNIYDLENSDIDKLIILKHQKFLETIPENFRNRFDKVQYYYVTEYGEGFVPFVVKDVLGFELENDKKDTKKISKNIPESV